MGTPILARAVVTVGATDALPGITYCFLAPYGVYVGDIAIASGVLGATGDNTYEDNVLIPVRDLIRAELLLTTKVIVQDPNTLVKYIKTLHYSADKIATFKTDIKTKLWPVGKGAGQPITGNITSVRVKSRQ